MCLLLCGRHMECAYYFVDGTWNVPTYFDFSRLCPLAIPRAIDIAFVHWILDTPGLDIGRREHGRLHALIKQIEGSIHQCSSIDLYQYSFPHRSTFYFSKAHRAALLNPRVTALLSSFLRRAARSVARCIAPPTKRSKMDGSFDDLTPRGTRTWLRVGRFKTYQRRFWFGMVVN